MFTYSFKLNSFIFEIGDFFPSCNHHRKWSSFFLLSHFLVNFWPLIVANDWRGIKWWAAFFHSKTNNDAYRNTTTKLKKGKVDQRSIRDWDHKIICFQFVPFVPFNAYWQKGFVIEYIKKRDYFAAPDFFDKVHLTLKACFTCFVKSNLQGCHILQLIFQKMHHSFMIMATKLQSIWDCIEFSNEKKTTQFSLSIVVSSILFLTRSLCKWTIFLLMLFTKGPRKGRQNKLWDKTQHIHKMHFVVSRKKSQPENEEKKNCCRKQKATSISEKVTLISFKLFCVLRPKRTKKRWDLFAWVFVFVGVIYASFCDCENTLNGKRFDIFSKKTHFFVYFSLQQMDVNRDAHQVSYKQMFFIYVEILKFSSFLPVRCISFVYISMPTDKMSQNPAQSFVGRSEWFPCSKRN